MSSNPTWIDYRELQTAPKRKQQDDFPHEYICVSEGAANAYLPEMDFISRVCFLCAHFDISSGYFSDDEFILTYYRHCSYHERRHTRPPHQSPHISQMLCAAPWIKVIAIQLTYLALRRKKYDKPTFKEFILQYVELLKDSGVLHDWNTTNFGVFAGSPEEFAA